MIYSYDNSETAEVVYLQLRMFAWEQYRFYVALNISPAYMPLAVDRNLWDFAIF